MKKPKGIKSGIAIALETLRQKRYTVEQKLQIVLDLYLTKVGRRKLITLKQARKILGIK